MRPSLLTLFVRFRLCLVVSLFGGTLLSARVLSAPVVVNEDPDLEIQGEYVGPDRMMHAVARGDGEFEITVYEATNGKRRSSDQPPQRLDGDEDTVLGIAEGIGAERFVRESSTLGASPPENAIVLFDGTADSLSNWVGGKIETIDEDSQVLVAGTQTKQTFRDYRLHLEFRTPFMPLATGQKRGNSGVYHQARYETQILDSFGIEAGKNDAGSIYDIKAPDVNACLPPMQWQTYDVEFTGARFDGAKKVADARLTVRLNGIVVQSDVAVPRATRASKLKEGPEDGPLYLQDHGDAVRFRNIWLVPRDAEREAARPIVTGYERFFASTEDPQGMGGELLINRLGCTSCHSGAEGVLPASAGPDLSQVRERIQPDALVAMIANPHQAKRGTRMPDPWAQASAEQRSENARAITSYLLATGEQPDLRQRSCTPTVVARGKELFHSVGCVACHAPQEGEPTPAATTVPLGNLAQKYTIDSLARLIANPHQTRPGGNMPSLVGDISEAVAIAGYLTRSVTERENEATFRRRFYQGQWEKLPDFDRLKPIFEDQTEGLEIADQKKRITNSGFVFESHLSIAAAGSYTVSISSDDGSRITLGKHSVANDGIHGVTTQSGTFDLEAGVYPVRVEWFNKDGGYELQVKVTDPLLGDVPLADLITDPTANPASLSQNAFQIDESMIGKGEHLFKTSGCASCHNFNEFKHQPNPLAVAADLVDLDLQKGCLSETVAAPAVDYFLSPSQKDAIRKAIVGRRSGDSLATSITDEDLVHLTMAGQNCYACHRRDGVGGPEPTRDAWFQTTTAEMGWEGRLPPPLNGVGDKLTDNYLQKLLAEGENERPYMLTRMPGFGDGRLQRLHDSLVRLDRVESGNDLKPSTEQQIQSDGRKLVGNGGLACIKCHAYNGEKGGGIGAIDLLAMSDRLRSDWFVRYLQNPTKYRPGTRMPNSFPDGQSTYESLYDRDPHKQINAMWAYLNAGTSVKEPAGLRPGAILLAADDEPVIYRNFFNNTSGRGIAVGYPNEVNLIWDAEQMSLNSVWKREFIDASRHWNGRGQGRVGPAGDQIVALENWTPLVATDSVKSPWPSESARELGHQFRGYQLDERGQPRFRYSIGTTSIEDIIVPVGPKGAALGFDRTLVVQRASADQPLVWRMAVGESIRPDGDGYLVEGVRIEIDGAACEILTLDGQSELRALIPDGLRLKVTQRLRW